MTGLAMRGRHKAGTPRKIALFCSRLPAKLDAGQTGCIQLVADGLSETPIVASWPYEAKDKPDALADDVLESAQGDCDGRGTTSQYLLQALIDDRPVQSYRIRCQPEEEDPVGSADVQGIIAQSLKHNEVLMRATLGAMAGTLQEMREVNALLARRLEVLEGTHRDALEAQKEAMAIAAVASTDTVSEEKKQERIDRLIRLGEMWLMKSMDESKKSTAGKVVQLAADVAAKKGEGA